MFELVRHVQTSPHEHFETGKFLYILLGMLVTNKKDVVPACSTRRKKTDRQTHRQTNKQINTETNKQAVWNCAFFVQSVKLSLSYER